MTLRGMWFDVQTSDLDFTESSPHRIENHAILDATPERIFQIFAEGESQREWFKDFVANRWTSPEPHGAGATREVELKMLTVKELFLAWEPGRRLTFTITAITLPVVRRMVEDLHFTPEGEGTRFDWVVHYEPTLLMAAVHPIARGVFGKLFRETTQGLAAYARRYPSR